MNEAPSDLPIKAPVEIYNAATIQFLLTMMLDTVRPMTAEVSPKLTTFFDALLQHAWVYCPTRFYEDLPPVVRNMMYNDDEEPAMVDCLKLTFDHDFFAKSVWVQDNLRSYINKTGIKKQELTQELKAVQEAELELKEHFRLTYSKSTEQSEA